MAVLLFLFFLIGSGALVAGAETPASRQDAVLIRNYQGPHKAEFTVQFDRVRLLVRQAQVEVSSRLGLIQYREGFRYPLQIRFEDGAPPGIESALAYVQLMQSKTDFKQELVVNLDALAAHPAGCQTTDAFRPECGADFDTVFYHEMTHAVMNDAVGGEATVRIPHWVQEGLAIYISGEGDRRVRAIAGKRRQSQVHLLLFELEGPVSGEAYPQYYLSIKYMLDVFSINAVQALVRNLIAGKPLVDSIQDCTGLSWTQYKKNVRDYSLKVFRDAAIADTSRMTSRGY